MIIQTFEKNSIDNCINEVSDFLFKHLDQYGDKVEDIHSCIAYARDKGGQVIVASDNASILGAVVLNETGMSGYIPENILVYIAVSSASRGEGVGKKLMEKAIFETKGDIALHVEKSNPARFLYEKMGFNNPYLEMRYKRD
jgi:ribosomal protein S18 acetylase RimI-like enzyme